MDPVSAILGALVAGASAAGAEVGSAALKDAYLGLKTVLTDTYAFVSTKLLEKKPADPGFQEAVRSELAASVGLIDDPLVLEKTKAIQDAIAALPSEKAAVLGIDIETLKVGGNLIAERIRDGIRGKDWSATGDVRFTDVGGSSGNS
jgi:hypothetical protein